MKRTFWRTSMVVAALLIGLLAFAVIPIPRQAHAQGEQTSITRTLTPFTSLQLKGGGQATLEFGPAPSITIAGNSLIVDRLEPKVENGTLIVGSLLTSALDITRLSELTYTIVTPSIEAIHLEGTVDLHIDPMPAQPSLVLGLSLGSEVFIPSITAGAITGKLDLLSTAHLAGSANTMQLEINNGSHLDAADLQVGAADLVLNGMAKATVRVTTALTGRAAQGSTLSFISQTVQPNIDLTTMASVAQLPYTAWTVPIVLTTPVASPAT